MGHTYIVLNWKILNENDSDFYNGNYYCHWGHHHLHEGRIEAV